MPHIFKNGMSLEEVRRALRFALQPKYGDREATAMARTALMSLKGWNLSELMANEDRLASDYILGRSEEILKQLLADMPLQYALGETHFHGLTLKVRPGVLIPRPETEELVDIIVKENPQSDLRVLDLCTGSGAIALALARSLPFSQVDAVDIAPEAIEIARENAASLKTDIKITQGDVFSLSLPSGYYDIIVSNPPYIDESERKDMEANVLSYEPHLALFVSDDDPLKFYRRISSMAREALVDGGRLYFEINPRHARELKSCLEEDGFTEVEILKDIHGKDRFATAINSDR